MFKPFMPEKYGTFLDVFGETYTMDADTWAPYTCLCQWLLI